MGRLRILAFDTVLDACSAAVWDDGSVTARREIRRAGHAEALVPMIARVMAEAGRAFGDLDAVAVTRGPGSFTGLRIGLAAARGIGLAARVPILGVTALEAVAFPALAHVSGIEPVLVAQEARREVVYAQAFEKEGDDLRPLSAPAVVPVADFAALAPPGGGIVVGAGAAGVEAAMGLRRVPVPDTPDAAHIAALAAVRIARRGIARFRMPPAPLYLRSAGAERPSSAKCPSND